MPAPTVGAVLSRIAQHGVRQRQLTDCGPAALATLLRYWGFAVSVGRLHDLCGRDAQGATFESLYHAGNSIGADLVAVLTNSIELSRMELPCIVPILGTAELSHFVVLAQVSSEVVKFWDPMSGLVSLSLKEFEACWPTRFALARIRRVL